MTTALTSTLLSLHLFFNDGNLVLLLLSLIFLLSSSIGWAICFLEEETSGKDNLFILDSLNLAIIFFIGGEALLFATFFWSWFNHNWSPTPDISSLNTPLGVSPVEWLSIPLINTVLLLASAGTLTVAHHLFISNKNRNSTFLFLGVTLLLASVFIGIQALEYLNSTFSMSDSNFGSTFFLITGFHGIHVVLGIVLLLTSIAILTNSLVSSKNHLFFELSIYYYHFVDVVWLGLFFIVYYQTIQS